MLFSLCKGQLTFERTFSLDNFANMQLGLVSRSVGTVRKTFDEDCVTCKPFSVAFEIIPTSVGFSEGVSCVLCVRIYHGKMLYTNESCLAFTLHGSRTAAPF